MTFPLRQMYARITISADAIQEAAARDRALNRRMLAGGLSVKLARKAWRRIRGARWGRIVRAEYADIIRVLQIDAMRAHSDALASVEEREAFWQDLGRP